MEAIVASTAFKIATTAFSVLGAISSANAESSAYQAKANTDTYNAEVAKRNAEVQAAESASEQSRHRRQVRQVMGEQRAAIAQSGTGFGGSNKDIVDRTATLAELDAMNIAYEGQARYQAAMSQSSIDSYSAGVNRSNARNARTAGYINAGKSILTSVALYGKRD